VPPACPSSHPNEWMEAFCYRLLSKKRKRPVSELSGPAFLDLIPAVTYVPTQLPVQYHRPCEA
jgi:hypothetical protein